MRILLLCSSPSVIFIAFTLLDYKHLAKKGCFFLLCTSRCRHRHTLLRSDKAAPIFTLVIKRHNEDNSGVYVRAAAAAGSSECKLRGGTTNKGTGRAVLACPMICAPVCTRASVCFNTPPPRPNQPTNQNTNNSKFTLCFTM